MVPGLSGARATIRKLLFCVLENLGFSGILSSRTAEQSAAGDFRVRTKSHLSKDSRRDTIDPERTRESARTQINTGRESAREGTSTRASAKKDVVLGVEVTLTDREPHDYLPKNSKRDSRSRER